MQRFPAVTIAAVLTGEI